MLHEYAIEPDALSEFNAVWQALEQFGVPQGRLISNFPGNWLRLVYEATAACPDYQRKSLEVRLEALKERRKLIPSRRAYDPKSSWRENAHGQQQAVPPFHAIIQADNPEEREDVLTEMELHEQHRLWRVSTQRTIPRVRADLAAAIAPLGQISQELHFVDPYFGTGRKWSSVLIEFLRVCQTKTRQFRTIQVHTGTKTPRAFLESVVKQQIAPKIAAGVRVRFCLWRERAGGEKFHARYFLTDRGGIGFDVGLDEGEPGETTDVRLLDQELYEARWRDFQDSTAAYELADQFTLIGTASADPE